MVIRRQGITKRQTVHTFSIPFYLFRSTLKDTVNLFVHSLAPEGFPFYLAGPFSNCESNSSDFHIFLCSSDSVLPQWYLTQVHWQRHLLWKVKKLLPIMPYSLLATTQGQTRIITAFEQLPMHPGRAHSV